MNKSFVCRAVACLTLSLLPMAALAEASSSGETGGETGAMPVATVPDYMSMHYSCDREVPVQVTYVNAAEGSLAVLMLENRQVVLENEVSASGARYGTGDDSGSYVWWSKGDSAFLMWRKQGEETTILDNCHAAAG